MASRSEHMDAVTRLARLSICLGEGTHFNPLTNTWDADSLARFHGIFVVHSSMKSLKGIWINEPQRRNYNPRKFTRRVNVEDFPGEDWSQRRMMAARYAVTYVASQIERAYPRGAPTYQGEAQTSLL